MLLELLNSFSIPKMKCVLRIKNLECMESLETSHASAYSLTGLLVEI